MHSGFAAGCEARLCLAVKILKGMGYALGSAFGQDGAEPEPRA